MCIESIVGSVDDTGHLKHSEGWSSMSAGPNFTFSQTTVPNHLSGRTYTMCCMAALEATEEFLDSVVKVCNETKIYDWLFRQRLHGAPYPKKDAERFKQWGTQGWQEGTHFLFIVLDRGLAAAACDIKSADLNGAEIGYWASEKHRGIMTNAVRSMISAGFAAGFRRFYGRVRPGNAASAAVLIRAGFVPTTEFTDGGYDAFEIRRETLRND